MIWPVKQNNNEILCYLRFFHFALDGQKTELIFRCTDTQKGAALRRRKKFYAKLHNILCRWYWSWRVTADSLKMEGIKGNRRRKFAEIGRRSHWSSFFLRHRGFERVSTGCRAPDRVGPKSGLPWFTKAHFLDIFFTFLASTVRIALFKCAWHTKIWNHLYINR